jgi:uncharacterized protein YgbK (DUF1537 family)
VSGRLLVIADDLSGAAEISGIGARFGLPVRLERDAPVVAHAGLTVIDTDTRLMPQDDADDAVRKAVRHLDPRDFDLIYKKTDSAMRGPLLAELEALTDAVGRRGALLVAQNPSRGRVIRSGRYEIDGVPLDETSFADDPEYPAKTAAALELLGKSAKRATQVVAPGAELPDEGVTIGEAATADDVARWAAEATEAAHVLPAGGADFFAALLAARGFSPARDFLTSLPRGRTLFVCGTSPAFSGPVCARAAAEKIDLCPMPEHTRGAADSLESWALAADTALDASARAVVVIRRPLDRTPGMPARFQAAVAEVVARVLRHGRGADNLLLEGGATASAVCRRMSWHQFEVEGEFAAGVVQMRAVRPDGSSQHRVVIKPGSYEWPEAVWRQPASA